MKAPRRKHRGFTLVEVLLVVAILVMLAGVVIFALGRTPEKTKIKLTRVMVEQVCTGLERYKQDIGHYPTEEEGGLKGLRTEPDFAEPEKYEGKWGGPYLTKDPVDQWDNAINYQLTDPQSDEARLIPYRVWSNGPDGSDDQGESDDIRNQAWADAAKTD